MMLRKCALFVVFVGFALGVLAPFPLFAGYEEGVAEFKKGNYAGALKEWQGVADSGDGQAATALGALYDRGLGVKEDDNEAAKWYLIGAETGHAQAMRNLANLYATGQGVPYDMSQARLWYEKAAELGDDKAIRQLAKINNRPLPPEPAQNQQVASTKPTIDRVSSNSFSAPSNDIASQPPPTPASRPVTIASNSTVEDLRTKPVLPAPPKNGPSGPSVKAAPVPKVQETALAQPAPPDNSGEATSDPQSADTSPLLVASAPDANSGENTAPNTEPAANAAPVQSANLTPAPVSTPAVAGNWLIGQWQGPTLGCPPNGGLAFTNESVDTYYNGRVIVSLKAQYQVDGPLITVTTQGLDGSKQDYVYRQMDADRFVIEKVPASMPASLVGVEHKKCTT